MNANPLPDDLATLEEALRRDRPEPAPVLRDRVMSRVRGELDSSRRTEFRWYLSGVAAVVLLGLNLSMSAVAWSSRAPRLQRPSTAALCEQLDEMQLGIPRDELRGHRLRMAAGQGLAPYPRPCGSASGALVPLAR